VGKNERVRGAAAAVRRCAAAAAAAGRGCGWCCTCLKCDAATQLLDSARAAAVRQPVGTHANGVAREKCFARNTNELGRPQMEGVRYRVRREIGDTTSVCGLSGTGGRSAKRGVAASPVLLRVKYRTV
jgi:hypothetical protein